MSTNPGNYVLAILMLVIGAFFAWRAWEAITSGVTVNVTIVERDSQPIRFFVATAVQVIAAVVLTLMGVLGIAGIIPSR